MSKTIVDRYKSLLIMGNAETDFKLNEIYYCNENDDIKSLFGDSPLYRAYTEARKVKKDNIFLMNVKNKFDYIDAANIVSQYEFAYITPINLYLTDQFYHPKKEQNMFFYQYALEVCKETDSLFICTDKHALLYEDIDHFINEMQNIIFEFKNHTAYANLDKSNICFVTNNLKNFQFANVVLGAVLSETDLDKYPDFNFGEAVFDIDNSDVHQDMIYFKNNQLINTTPENLVNFEAAIKPEKLIKVKQICKYISKEFDIEEFKGSFFTQYHKTQLLKKYIGFMDSLVNYLIRDYRINSVDIDRDQSGAYTISIDTSFTPINSFTECHMKIKG